MPTSTDRYVVYCRTTGSYIPMAPRLNRTKNPRPEDPCVTDRQHAEKLATLIDGGEVRKYQGQSTETLYQGRCDD